MLRRQISFIINKKIYRVILTEHLFILFLNLSPESSCIRILFLPELITLVIIKQLGNTDWKVMYQLLSSGGKNGFNE